MTRAPESAGRPTPRELLVFYFQPTLGHAHRARVHALNAQPGIRCIGVQYADRELTRAAHEVDDPTLRTLLPGYYERLPSIRRVTSALQLARELRPHAAIIDCPADAVQFATGIALQRSGVATFVRWASTREDYPRRAWRELLKRPIYGRWDGYFATGTRAAAYLRDFGVRDDRVFVCGNPSELARTLEVASTGTRESTFLFVGRFIWHKNLDGLLSAYELYRELGGTFGLEFAGGGSGELSARIAARAERTPGVRLRGFLAGPELARAYLRASCLVLPSISENWGLVVNEAMHASLPVIVSDRCGCIPELLRDGENGLVVDPEQPRQIADALLRMERIGAERRIEMGARSKALAAPHTAENWAERVARGLRTTCGRAGLS